MEPVDYVKIFKNHWKVVVALVVLALAAVYITTPKKANKAFSADAVLYMAGLPLDANVQFLTITATAMPFIGRG